MTRTNLRLLTSPCALAGALALSLLLSGPTAHAAPGDIGTHFAIDDQNPLKSIPTPEEREKNPLEFGYWLQDLIARAEGSFEKKDWPGTVKYYEALAHAVPEVPVSFSRLCQGYEALGKLDLAAANCGKVLSLKGALVRDHFHFIELTLRKQQLLPADISNVDASLAHLREHASEHASAGANPAKPAAVAGATPRPDLQTSIDLLDCRLAVRVRALPRLDACLAHLRAKGVEEKLALPFEWSRAVVTDDEPRASALLERAAALGFSGDSLREMRAEQARAFARHGMLAGIKRHPLPWLGGLLAALLLAGVTVGKVMRGRQRRVPALRGAASTLARAPESTTST